MKKAFTLMEVLVSVTLLGLISLFVMSTISQTKNNNKLFERLVKQENKIEKLVEVLHDDIYFSKSITIQSYKRYSIVTLKTRNSIYNIKEPYVNWLVLKKNNTLMRLESAKKISLPIKQEFKNYTFIDKGVQNCKNFSISLSKNKKNVLVFMEQSNKKPVIFEVKLFK